MPSLSTRRMVRLAGKDWAYRLQTARELVNMCWLVDLPSQLVSKSAAVTLPCLSQRVYLSG
eukprot:3355981-Prorocentrum_lima.AAC.1